MSYSIKYLFMPYLILLFSSNYAFAVMNTAKSCPTGQVYNPIKKMCVKEVKCPSGKTYDFKTEACVQSNMSNMNMTGQVDDDSDNDGNTDGSSSQY